ncbi:SDR family NAD(P)-dependent oxidoreductase [Lipingzhangella sp. LS1_29]|uniref:SDR family NAD(P)-dependent oxidoreductase n=1 Tax=Lipingzhangella rawalii TaxID=2055835 RepID=A0ABU2H4A1_9ACTN|nr:SDR family NAD(P)-dependent oxidoreductase [Lipingzhangella rawalii]MDS1270128.1 SDR family NAD(P)-dependent oxidoreductase [Lipingzhangella rawalii]
MGKVAIVTGGTSGIGLACARRFVDNDDTVIISGRSAERGQQAITELDAGNKARYIQCDVTDPSQIRQLVEETVDEYRRVDILVNNAGGGPEEGPLVTERDDESLSRAFTLNVNSAFWASRCALPHMLPRGYGRIINMSSIAGKTGMPGLAGYSTAKHALLGFTKTLAKEVTARGVSVNAVCPGITDTDMIPRELNTALDTAGIDIATASQHYTGDLGRMVTPDEVASLVLALASTDSGAISGTAISVDGGFTQF